ncbi:MAG: Dabb family protein [Clostridia bacterium]|nr:Dabb family protein [Clostridiales bacterium]MBR2970658.1 Dabb family protein [Clostridia bacterium]
MVKHIVMYKLKDRSNADEMIARFLSMRGKIDVLRSLHAGKDEIKSARAYDVALVCEFDSLEDLNIYAEHPVHLPVKEYVHSVIAEAHSVDFIE